MKYSALTSIHIHGQRRPILSEVSSVTLFKPASSWRAMLFDPALVGLFFKVTNVERGIIVCCKWVPATRLYSAGEIII